MASVFRKFAISDPRPNSAH